MGIWTLLREQKPNMVVEIFGAMMMSSPATLPLLLTWKVHPVLMNI